MTREEIVQFIEDCWDTSFDIEERSFLELNDLERIKLISLIAEIRLYAPEAHKHLLQELQE